MRFTDIPQYLTNKANYKIDVAFKYFSKTIRQFVDEDGLIQTSVRNIEQL